MSIARKERQSLLKILLTLLHFNQTAEGHTTYFQSHCTRISNDEKSRLVFVAVEK